MPAPLRWQPRQRCRPHHGTILLSVLSVHSRYAHINGIRGDGVNPELLGLSRTVSEDAVRTAMYRIQEIAGLNWLSTQILGCISPSPTGINVKAKKKSRANGAHESHGKAEAERLAVEALAVLGVSSARKDLEGLRKGDRVKVLDAALLRKRTAAGNGWIAERLGMGHHGSVSRLVVAVSKDEKHEREPKKLMKMFKCGS